MKSTGIVRKVDELGRIVLPAELMATRGIDAGTPMEIYVDGNMIALRKYAPGCVFCGTIGDDVKDVDGVRMCLTCANSMAVKYWRAQGGGNNHAEI